MEQDKLKKQIELLTKELDVLIQSVKVATGKETSTSIEGVNKCLMKNLNINLEEINSIPLEHFIATITIDSQLNNINLDRLADLLFKTAGLFKLENKKETAKRLYQRTLQIYIYLARAEVEFPFERHLRIKELREILLQ